MASVLFDLRDTGFFRKVHRQSFINIPFEVDNLLAKQYLSVGDHGRGKEKEMGQSARPYHALRWTDLDLRMVGFDDALNSASNKWRAAHKRIGWTRHMRD